MATTKEDAENFLCRFKEKKKVFDIAFDRKTKNIQGYLDLDITPAAREIYIEKLTADEYSSGPNEDTHTPGSPDYWVFGSIIKNKEVYIKLTMGQENNRVVCMSFHIAEGPMSYPFK